jgi:curved DNA-binding protein CbpA
MDFYGVLRVPSNAKQIDIDRAYQRIVQEARYDSTIRLKDVEVAYKILSDATQRALYDAGIAEKNKKLESTAKIRTRIARSDRRFKVMVGIVVALTLVAAAYLFFRFGYMLKSYEQGSALYFKENHKYLGKINKIEDDHSFGPRSSDAYLIQLSNEETLWLPADDVKSLCYEKK